VSAASRNGAPPTVDSPPHGWRGKHGNFRAKIKDTFLEDGLGGVLERGGGFGVVIGQQPGGLEGVVAALGKEGEALLAPEVGHGGFSGGDAEVGLDEFDRIPAACAFKEEFAELGGLGFGQVEKLGVRSGFLGGGVWLGFHGF
jgi:hypothetical protein